MSGWVWWSEFQQEVCQVWWLAGWRTGRWLDGEGGQGLEDSDESFDGNVAGPEHGEADQREAPGVGALSGFHCGLPYGRGELVPEP